jgi:hypothetical protein
MKRIKYLSAYSVEDLYSKLEVFLMNQELSFKYSLKSVTVGPDNIPEHRLSGQIYTAWLEIDG